MSDNEKAILLPAVFRIVTKAAASPSRSVAGDVSLKSISLTYRNSLIDPGFDEEAAAGHSNGVFISGELRRTEPGGDLGLPARFEAFGERIPVNVRHLSSSGAILEGAITIKVGELASLMLESIGQVQGLITWQAGHRFGFLFANQIDVSPPDPAEPEIASGSEIRAAIEMAMPQMGPGDRLGFKFSAEDGSPLGPRPVEFLLIEDDERRPSSARQANKSRVLAAPRRTARPSWLPQDMRLVAALVVTTIGTAGALLSGQFEQAPPVVGTSRQSTRVIAGGPAAHQSMASLAPSARTTLPDIFPTRTEPTRQAARSSEIALRSSGVAPVRAAAEQYPSGASGTPAEPSSEAEAPAFDPYAGRVAKPLSGSSLQSALAADRLATKELNLRQLHQNQTDAPDASADGSEGGLKQ